MQAMDNRFLAGKPEKYAYMWRDIARQAEAYGFAANVPVPHPIAEFDRAHRVAILGMREGWGVPFIKASFRRWFELRQEPGSEPNLGDSLRELGLNPADITARADGEDIAATLTAETAAARALGIFGAPTFAVGTELFWGNDRLEHAIAWAKTGRVG
jgi:2-hydroxychromene-2-carboxylate isomerase